MAVVIGLLGMNLIIPEEDMFDFLIVFSSPFFRTKSFESDGGAVIKG